MGQRKTKRNREKKSEVWSKRKGGREKTELKTMQKFRERIDGVTEFLEK
jgi:hypothetical protein